jgi:hypothetical protein
VIATNGRVCAIVCSGIPHHHVLELTHANLKKIKKEYNIKTKREKNEGMMLLNVITQA